MSGYVCKYDKPRKDEGKKWEDMSFAERVVTLFIEVIKLKEDFSEGKSVPSKQPFSAAERPIKAKSLRLNLDKLCLRIQKA